MDRARENLSWQILSVGLVEPDAGNWTLSILGLLRHTLGGWISHKYNRWSLRGCIHLYHSDISRLPSHQTLFTAGVSCQTSAARLAVLMVVGHPKQSWLIPFYRLRCSAFIKLGVHVKMFISCSRTLKVFHIFSYSRRPERLTANPNRAAVYRTWLG